MAQQMMWIAIEETYRGQASDGAVITVNEDTMLLAHKKAGRDVFEADWWTGTLTRILEHWGIYGKRWMDQSTRVPRMHFNTGEPRQIIGGLNPNASGPLSSRLNSGPLSTKHLPQDPPER